MTLPNLLYLWVMELKDFQEVYEHFFGPVYIMVREEEGAAVLAWTALYAQIGAYGDDDEETLRKAWVAKEECKAYLEECRQEREPVLPSRLTEIFAEGKHKGLKVKWDGYLLEWFVHYGDSYIHLLAEVTGVDPYPYFQFAYRYWSPGWIELSHANESIEHAIRKK